MKTILFIFCIAILASCSTAYKSGQTPDDVYYSKPRVELEKEVREDKRVGRFEESYEDAQIRMAIRNQRWRSLDYDNDFNYSYNPYRYGFNYGYYYNPYFYPYPVYNGTITFVNPKNTTIRTTNLGSYNNNVVTYSPTKSGNTNRTISTRRYYDSNNPTRRNTNIFGNTDTRTYTPSSGGSSGGSSNSPSGGGTITRPGRGR